MPFFALFSCLVVSQGGGQRRLTAYELAERAGHTKASGLRGMGTTWARLGVSLFFGLVGRATKSKWRPPPPFGFPLQQPPKLHAASKGTHFGGTHERILVREGLLLQKSPRVGCGSGSEDLLLWIAGLGSCFGACFGTGSGLLVLLKGRQSGAVGSIFFLL